MVFFKRKSLKELRSERKKLEQNAVSSKLLAQTKASKKELVRLEKARIRELKYGGLKRTARQISGYAATVGEYGSKALKKIDKFIPKQSKTKRKSTPFDMPGMFEYPSQFEPGRGKGKRKQRQIDLFSEIGGI